MLWPAVIGAGASLLGGMLSRPKTRSARDETRGGIMGQAQGAREAAEKYGFNPLTLLASSSPMGSSVSQNYMGSAIADAGMIVAEAMAKRSDAGQTSQLEAENARLKQQIQQQTLRPKVGGVYARRETIPQVAGDGNLSSDDIANRLRDPVSITAGQAGGLALPDQRLDRGTGIYIAGNRLDAARGTSPASVIEEEYGDAASWVYGFAKLGADLGHNFRLNRDRRKTISEIDRATMDSVHRANGYPLSSGGIYQGAKDFWLRR